MQCARVGNMGERRAEFGRPEEEFPRGLDYDNQRYYPNDVPRTYHGEEHRSYHPENAQFGNMRRNGPPRREEGYQYYRGGREEPQPGGRQADFRTNNRTGPQPNVRVQGPCPTVRSLSAVDPDGADDTLMQAILNLERGEDRDHFRRKAAFPPQRDRSPLKREMPPSPHSRSGSSVSSRSYSPDKGKSYTYPNQQKKSVDVSGQGPSRGACPPLASGLPQNSGNVVQGVDVSGQGPSRGACPPLASVLPQNSGNVVQDKDRPPSHPTSGSRDASPQSSASASKMNVDKASRPLDPQPDVALREKAREAQDRPSDGHTQFEEPRGLEGEQEEVALPVRHEPAAVTTTEDFLERRSQAIAAKAREIEQVFRHDCETFGMVVKMLVAKEPSLESQLQSPLRENLGEIQQRCLEDLRHFICELDEVLHPETSS